MYNSDNLLFFTDVLSKCRVQVSIHSREDKLTDVINEPLAGLLRKRVGVEFRLSDFIRELSPRTLYKTINRFSLCYNYLLLEESNDPSVLLIGPYLSAPIYPSDLLEILEKNGISPSSQKLVGEYYAGVPVLAADDRAFTIINTFCEHLWDTSSFAVVDFSDNTDLNVLTSDAERRDDFDSIIANMKLMEKRYSFENELMEAVALGQIHKEAELLSSFSGNIFERRILDPIRNAKNYSIIMNTLLRKAAEKGGVHPIYIDRISSEFAAKIEAVTSLPDNFELMLDMFKSYCRLVRKHSMQGLSPIVRKTILMIDSDLSADLSLSSLADAQSVSSGYLATIFKKEIGKTVSEFIRQKRIKEAKKLLASTHLQVQTVAVHCGIMDVQYFTKQFKKETGMTPKQYREYIKNNPKL